MTKVFFETFVGRQRKSVWISEAAFCNWVNKILADHSLQSSILDLIEGRVKFEDLDEGSAGIFPERLVPEDIRFEIREKLEDISLEEREVLTTFLIPKIFEAVRLKNA